MKKLFYSFVFMLLCVFTLASCDKKEASKPNNDNTNEVENEANNQQPDNEINNEQQENNINNQESNNDNHNESGVDNNQQPDNDQPSDSLPPIDENDYYASVLRITTKSELRTELHKLIEQSHTKHLTYKEVWTACELADEDPNNSNNVLCIYSNISMPKANHVGSTQTAGYWNREHLFPQSRGFKKDGAVAHNDVHHIRATECIVNSKRGDTDFGNVTGNVDKYGNKQNSNYFEPRDEVKGDIARSLFYMVIRYDEDDYTSYTYDGKTYTDNDDLDLELISGTSTTAPISTGEYVLGDIETLLMWAKLDPVSEEEKRRNEVVYEIQGNRNPFIDHPEFISMIFE